MHPVIGTWRRLHSVKNNNKNCLSRYRVPTMKFIMFQFRHCEYAVFLLNRPLLLLRKNITHRVLLRNRLIGQNTETHTQDKRGYIFITINKEPNWIWLLYVSAFMEMDVEGCRIKYVHDSVLWRVGRGCDFQCLGIFLANSRDTLIYNLHHYSCAIMSAMASQISSVSIVCSNFKISQWSNSWTTKTQI